jgi:Protein of unknown function (DUF2800)
MPLLNAHATLGASSAYRWMECPGSIRLCRGIQSPSSVYAEEGSAAHYLAEQCLRRNDNAEKYLEWFVGFNANEAGFLMEKDPTIRELDKGISSFPVTEEMADAVQVYLDTIRKDQIDFPDAQIMIEKKFDLSALYPGMFGTNDCCLAEPFGKLIVYDFKYGRGHAVNVEDNPQLRYYALGAYQDEDFFDIEIVIVQPRARHKDGQVRRWTTNAAELRDWAGKVLISAAKATEDPAAPLKAGDHCKFCPALPSCPEIHRHAMEVAKSDFSTIALPPADQLSKDDLIKVLQSEEILKTWLNSVARYAQQLLINGESLPGYKLVQRKTNRRWIDPDVVNKAMYLYKWAYEPAKILSVAQMEKAAKANKSIIDVTRWIEKPDGGLVIAPESDRRPAVEVKPAFEVIEESIDFL